MEPSEMELNEMEPSEMELNDALRTTGAVRNFRDEPVPREVVRRLLDTAGSRPAVATSRRGM